MIPSEVLEKKSSVPLRGLTTKPLIPLYIPTPKPFSPPSFAPLMGSPMTPVIPEAIPVKVLLTPRPSPSKTFLGFSKFSYSLLFI